MILKVLCSASVSGGPQQDTQDGCLTQDIQLPGVALQGPPAPGTYLQVVPLLMLAA